MLIRSSSSRLMAAIALEAHQFAHERAYNMAGAAGPAPRLIPGDASSFSGIVDRPGLHGVWCR